MPAPSENAIIENPRPLNPHVLFPYRIDAFPAQVLFGSQFANAASGQSRPKDAPPNPLRREP
jgi:hypothetical protein